MSVSERFPVFNMECFHCSTIIGSMPTTMQLHGVMLWLPAVVYTQRICFQIRYYLVSVAWCDDIATSSGLHSTYLFPDKILSGVIWCQLHGVMI